MKNLFVASLFLVASIAHAQSVSRPFGLGLILGSPTGVSGKFRTATDRSFDFGVGYHLGSYGRIWADYLFEFPGAFKSKDVFAAALVPYIGFGPVLGFASTGLSSYAGLGIRAVGGLEWAPKDPPLGVFLELAPGVGLIPGTFGFIDLGLGIRYYF